MRTFKAIPFIGSTYDAKVSMAICIAVNPVPRGSSLIIKQLKLN